MLEKTVNARTTKYCLAIEQTLKQLGHATNAELLEELRRTYPSLSATTVHRATARLASRGEIAVAPAAADGSMRYDANTKEHDHFQCSHCGVLRDTDIKELVAPVIEGSLEGCSISGRLTITGECKRCAKGLEE